MTGRERGSDLGAEPGPVAGSSAGRHHGSASACAAPRVRGDAGSAGLWVLTGGLLVLVLALVAGLREGAVVARHRSEAAADLAALATAQGIGVDATTAQMCRRGERIAALNGAHLQRCTVVLAPSARAGNVRVVTTVTVRFAGVGTGPAVARAQAQRDPGR